VQWIKPKPKELIALSDFVAMTFYKNHQVLPSHIIPYGIDPGLFSEEDYIRDIDILGAGSLIPLKQYELFITAISELAKKFPTIKTMLCGKGPEEQKLKQLILKLGLENNISLIGEMPHTEVLELMQRAKIFLHPSSYEGFGVVCIEALYAGAHVISFCKPMNEDILHWHIVKNENELLQETTRLLQSDHVDHRSVLPYSIDDCSKKIMQLFGYKIPAILKPVTIAHIN
jgi:glycosyltransferase involved in cell wall biosynthesis